MQTVAVAPAYSSSGGPASCPGERSYRGTTPASQASGVAALLSPGGGDADGDSTILERDFPQGARRSIMDSQWVTNSCYYPLGLG